MVGVLCVVFNTVSVLTTADMPGLLSHKQLTLANINKNIERIEFTVQNPVQQRVLEIKQELVMGVTKPFKDLVEAIEGDAAAGGQTPITFIRQVTALACLPELLNDMAFPTDVKTRVKDILQNCKGNSIGSLSDCTGLEIVRKHIAEFIQQRDCCPADWQNIIIVPGVSAAMKILFKLINYTASEVPTGTMTPIPEFPLFTDTLTDFGIEKVGYYLNEENGWSLDTEELERALSESKTYCHPRAILVVNPGNPTGQVLLRKNIENVIKFAEKERLLIIACEVYQDSVYDGYTFHSFKKVMFEMGAPYNQIELVSLMSCCKGYAGESGLRGGYVELVNIRPEISESLKKSIMLSDTPPMCAQIALDCVTNPPHQGEPSHPLYCQERAMILHSLGERARTTYHFINSIPGLSCQFIQGAFFAFVKVEIPEKAVEKAISLNQCPSTFYVMEMLENAGVVTLPGDGFGQKPDSYHFRITILLPEERLAEAMKRIQDFHIKFMDQYK